jgi:hypothetical protein
LPKDFKKIKPAKTETEAAARIEKLTRELQRQSALPQGAMPSAPPAAARTIPAAPPAAARPVRKKTAKTRTTAKVKTRSRSRRPLRRRAAR